MKRSELLFNIVAIPTDAAMLLLAAVASFYLRLQPSVVAKIPLAFNLQFHDFFLLSIKTIPVLILILAAFGLYNLRGTRNFARELGQIIAAISLSLLIIILVFFFNKNFFQDIFPSRFIILAAWGLGITFLFFGRLFLKLLQEYYFQKGVGLHRLAVVRGEAKETLILERIYKNRKHGYSVVAEFSYDKQTLQTLEELYSKNQIDEILQANPNLDDEANFQLVQFARGKGLQFSFVPNLFEAQRNIVELSSLPGDLDPSQSILVKYLAAMGGATDTPTLSGDFFFGIGGTKRTVATGAVTGTTAAVYTATIVTASIPTLPITLSAQITPGAHTTDTLLLYAMWIEYTKI
jgi:FlaA1/EpsC-like NDP-sugar epimerase